MNFYYNCVSCTLGVVWCGVMRDRNRRGGKDGSRVSYKSYKDEEDEGKV